MTEEDVIKLKELMNDALQDICGAKLCEINSMSSRVEMIRLMDSAIQKLKTGLQIPIDKGSK